MCACDGLTDVQDLSACVEHRFDDPIVSFWLAVEPAVVERLGEEDMKLLNLSGAVVDGDEAGHGATAVATARARWAHVSCVERLSRG